MEIEEGKFLKGIITDHVSFETDGSKSSSKTKSSVYVSNDEMYFHYNQSGIKVEMGIDEEFIYYHMKGLGTEIREKVSIAKVSSYIHEDTLNALNNYLSEELYYRMFSVDLIGRNFSGLSYYETGDVFTIELKLNNVNALELTPEVINLMFGYDYYQVLKEYTEYEIIYMIELTNNVLSGGGTKTYAVFEAESDFISYKSIIRSETVYSVIDKMTYLPDKDKYEEVVLN